MFKAGQLRFKQLTKNLKMRMLPETSILYVIRHASVILIVGFQQLRRVPTREICWKKNSAHRGSNQQPLDQRPSAFLSYYG